MPDFISLVCFAGALALLAVLSWIDLKIRLLPDKYVAAFALLGFIFHALNMFSYLSLEEMATGALTGGGILFIIRMVANRFYGRDTLGMGDVKLLGAAGFWLGPHYILVAMTIGALAGVAHGLGEAFYRWRLSGGKPDFQTLSVPAGPGFAVGIIVAGVLEFFI